MRSFSLKDGADTLYRYSKAPPAAPAPAPAPVAAPPPPPPAPVAAPAPTFPTNTISLADLANTMPMAAWNSSDFLSGVGGLAKSIGYTGPLQERTGRQVGSGSIDEGGVEGLVDEWGPTSGVSNALAGYRFVPVTDSGGNPAVRAFDQSGNQVGGDWRTGSSMGSFGKFMSMAVPALVTGGFGAALAPLALSGLGIGAAGAGGLSAGTLTAGATGAIGSGLNTAVHGGDLGDVLQNAALGGLTAGAGSAINTALVPAVNNALPQVGGQAFLPGVSTGVANTLDALGLPASVGEYASGLVPNVVTGAARGVLQGDILGGITSGVLGQAVSDVSSQLNLSPSQGRALATYMMNGDEAQLAISLGSGLAKQAIGAAETAKSNITGGASFPGYDSINYGDYGGFANEEFPGYDSINYGDYGGAYDYMGSTELPAEQQVVITGDKSPPDYDSTMYGDYGGFNDYTGIPPAEQQVIITGKKPLPDDGLELPPYEYAIPELAPLEPPNIEVETPLAPPLDSGSTSTGAKGLDIGALLSILGAGASANAQPEYTQWIGNIPGFNVEEALSPTLAAQHRAERMAKLSPQEQQLTALIEQLNRG